MLTREEFRNLLTNGPLLLDGATGETLCNLKLTGTTEASPVVFNNSIVIGTREKVYCLKVS